MLLLLTEITQPSKLIVSTTQKRKTKLPEEQLKFGCSFSDHMLIAEWDEDTGWGAPRIVPHGPLSIDPAAPCLHYSLELFEGMKAYKDAAGTTRLFRPDMNMQRLENTALRLCLPTPGKQEALKCIEELVKLDSDWIPHTDGFSLYIRPTLIATSPHLGVGPTQQAMFFTILSPVGPYYSTGFAPVAIEAVLPYVRAFKGGMGKYKAGGNYGPTILPQVEAAKKGYQQVLWLSGDEHYCTEVGTMNLFMFWTNEAGELELITPPLDDLILPGVTRYSILEIAREWGEFKVTEERFTMAQVISAVKDGRVKEMFGAGTAAIVSPVNRIGFDGNDYEIPLDANDPSKKIGPLTERLFKTLTDIQYGRDTTSKFAKWSVTL